MNKTIVKKLSEQNLPLDNVGTIVHLGAGNCIELADYQTLDPEHILLVEAHAEQAQSLRLKNKAQTNVTVVDKAIIGDFDSNDEKPFNYYCTRPSQFGGLVSPEPLKGIFKNLKVLSVTPIETCTLDELIDQYPLTTGKLHILVVQLNGYESELLTKLSPKILQQFSVVMVQSFNSAAKDHNQETLTSKALKLANYNLEIKEGRDLIFGNQVYVIDKNKIELEKVHRKNSLLVAENQELIQKVKEIDSNTEQKFEELQKRLVELSDHKQDQETLISKLTSEKEQVQTELVNKSIELEQLQNRSETIVADLTKRISEFESNTSKLDLEKLELENKISELSQNINEIAKQRDDERKKFQENKNRTELLNEQIGLFESELAEKSRSVNLGQKMLAKAQVDLDHLRESYAEKVKSEQELVDLIKELREKLMLASKYYFKLQQEHPELLTAVENPEGK